MQRWIPTLALVLVLQLALAAFVGWRQLRPAAPPVAQPLVTADLSAIDRVEIDGPATAAPRSPDTPPPTDTKIELVKQDGRWTLPGYHGVPADADKLKALLDRLHKGPRGLPVTTTTESLERFKVTDAEHERRLVAKAGDKVVATVYLGTAPSLRKAHLRSGDAEGVYAMEITANDFPLSGPEWIDPAMIRPAGDKLQSIELTPKGGPAITLTRDGGDWKAAGLPAGRTLDAKQAAALVDAMTGLQVNAVLGTAPQPDWGMDQPLLTLRWAEAAGAAGTTWVVGQAQGSEVRVLKPSDRGLYLELRNPGAQVLLDAATLDRLAPPPAAAASAPAAAVPDAPQPAASR